MPRRLLIVDDEDDILSIVGEFLVHVGYEVVAAPTGRAARDLIQAQGARFDIAVVDWGLPDLPGRDIVLALERRLPECRVVVTTGHGADVVSDTMVGPQVAAIVRKPFTMQGLKQRLDDILGPGG